MPDAREQHPWCEYVDRVLIHTPDYLDFDGNYSAGGRQRLIRDLAVTIKEWGRRVLIVQRGRKNFERRCENGIDVVGLRCNTSVLGDVRHARLTKRMIRARDAVMYASGEDAWPFFSANAKAIQHGIWWDGPFARWKLRIQKQRVLGLMRSIRSIACVDTNFINWLRGQGAEGLSLVKKCTYIPNYANLSMLPDNPSQETHDGPLRLIFARRFEEKRGHRLFLDALSILKMQRFPFVAKVFTVGGVEAIRGMLQDKGLLEFVQVSQASMDDMLAHYANVDVGVVPTLWSEGTSLACVEAICSGVPVITTPVGGLGNLVIPHYNGFIVPPLAKDLANAIRRFEDRALLYAFKKNCLAMKPALSLGRWKEEVGEWLGA